MTLNDLSAKLRSAKTKHDVEAVYQRAVNLYHEGAPEALIQLMNRCDAKWFQIHLTLNQITPTNKELS